MMYVFFRFGNYGILNITMKTNRGYRQITHSEYTRKNPGYVAMDFEQPRLFIGGFPSQKSVTNLTKKLTVCLL